MLKIENLHATVTGKPILNGLTLAVPNGEIQKQLPDERLRGPGAEAAGDQSRRERGVKATEISQGWAQEGTFKDADGVDVRCYDDVALLEATPSEPFNDGSVIMLPAGTSGTVLFFSTGEPCWLDLEYETDGIACGVVCGVVEARKTKLHLRNEEKYPR